jgi:DNA repair exonuclease SbcCD ATPase subunit
MISFKALAAMAMKCVHLKAVFMFAIALQLFICAANAQQPAIGRKKAPRLTTEDVIQPVTTQPAAESPKAEDANKPDAAKTDAAKTDGAKAEDAKQPAEVKASAEESAWRERASKARERAKALERAAEEAELRITELRNGLGVSGQSARYRNETAAELESAGQKLSDLRNQARAAKDDLNQLLEYGKENRFGESEGLKATSSDGKPNEDYYRARFAKLNEEAQSADRRIQLYENRVRDLQQHILLNGGKKGGDNFYTAQLQQDKEEAQQSLDEARAARSQALSKLEQLMEEARRAGMPPGVFR